MMLAIGVIGGHGAIFHHQNWAVLAGLGRAIAERAGTLVTGTCSGLPYAVVLGARAAGGLVVGISPASTRHDHLFRHGCPTEGYTMLLLTGAGAAGRDALVARSADIVVTIGDDASDLDQLETSANGRLIGILTGLDTATTAPPDLARWGVAAGAAVLYDHRPVTLIDRLIARYHDEHASRSHGLGSTPWLAVPRGQGATPTG